MPRLSPRLLVAAAALTTTVAFGFLVAGLLERGSRAGLRLTVSDAAGTVVLERVWPDADLRALAPLLPGRRPLRARLVGLWHVAEPGRVRLWLHSESTARVALDDHVVVQREAGAKAGGGEVEVDLPGGPRALELHVEFGGPATDVRLRVARGAEDWRGLDAFDLYPEAVDMMGAGRRGAARWLRRASAAGLALAAGLVLLAALRARRVEGA